MIAMDTWTCDEKGHLFPSTRSAHGQILRQNPFGKSLLHVQDNRQGVGRSGLDETKSVTTEVRYPSCDVRVRSRLVQSVLFLTSRKTGSEPQVKESPLRGPLVYRGSDVRGREEGCTNFTDKRSKSMVKMKTSRWTTLRDRKSPRG